MIKVGRPKSKEELVNVHFLCYKKYKKQLERETNQSETINKALKLYFKTQTSSDIKLTLRNAEIEKEIEILRREKTGNLEQLNKINKIKEEKETERELIESIKEQFQKNGRGASETKRLDMSWLETKLERYNLNCSIEELYKECIE